MPVSLSVSLLLAGLQAPQEPAHWAYRAPVREELPGASDGPRVIDALIERKWEAKGLVATGEADRAALARRLYLDLIGLPPTEAELAAFLDDERPHAYERLVDRLLASPHFGERWAVPWLDLARYGS